MYSSSREEIVEVFDALEADRPANTVVTIHRPANFSTMAVDNAIPTANPGWGLPKPWAN
jgi:hypothetical protein